MRAVRTPDLEPPLTRQISRGKKKGGGGNNQRIVQGRPILLNVTLPLSFDAIGGILLEPRYRHLCLA